MDQEIVGNPETWHIRLYARVSDVEIWSLYNGDKVESSPSPRRFVEQWMNDELAKLQSKG